MTTRNAPRTATTPRARESIDLDLDALSVDTAEPMVVKIGGKNVHFVAIQDLDWQVIDGFSQDRPRESIDAIIVEEDKEWFYAQKLSARKLDQLFNFYLEHFDVRPGESDA